MTTFMRAELTKRQDWYEVDGAEGGTWIPASDVGDLGLRDGETVNYDDNPTEMIVVASALRDYVGGEIWTVTLSSGFGVRSSAPGYMDRTDWCVYETEREAIAAYYAERAELDENDPEAAAFDTLCLNVRDSRLRDAWRFHAENSNTIVGERAAQALRFARAELWLLDLAASDRATIEIRADDTPLDDCGCGECGPNRDGKRPYQGWGVVVSILDNDGDKVSSESLWGIDIGDTGGIVPDFNTPSWSYLRTVRAELASELFAEFAPMTTIQ